MQEQDEIKMIYLKNGNMFIAYMDNETETDILISAAMCLRMIDFPDHHGFSLFPVIPFDVSSTISLSKTDVLFSVPANNIARDFYLDKLDENSMVISSFIENYYVKKKEFKKLMN